jgi:hypothetical protein
MNKCRNKIDILFFISHYCLLGSLSSSVGSSAIIFIVLVVEDVVATLDMMNNGFYMLTNTEDCDGAKREDCNCHWK